MNQVNTRIFKNKAFSRFAKKAQISDFDLCLAIANAEQDNISDDDLISLKKLAKKILNYNDAELNTAIQKKLFIEVTCNEQTISQ